MLAQDRRDLIAKLDRHIQPHRAPLSHQLKTIPMRALHRKCVARAALLASRLGWQGALQREMFFAAQIRFPIPACWDLWVYRSYIDEAELRLTKFIMRHLESGAELVDVGANIGFFTRLSSALVGASGHVHAFEPGTQALGFLRANVKGCDNVSIIAKAATEQTGEVSFFEGLGAAMVSSSLVESHTHDRDTNGVRKVTIPGIALDDYCAETGCVPRLIKVDVEGAELSVLRGAAQVMAQHHPWIVLEVSFLPEEYESQYAPCITLLAAAGYVPHVLDETGAARAISATEIPSRGDACAQNRHFLHALDNILFVHPAAPLQMGISSDSE